MFLKEEERGLFFKLYFDLLYCANKKHEVVEDFGNSRFPKSINTSQAYLIREEIFENPTWIDEYIEDYGEILNAEEIELVISWRKHFIHDSFYIMQHLTKYTVLMRDTDESETRLYGVTGLNHPISELYEKSALPAMIRGLLLPFNGKIIYDGIFAGYNLRIGPGIRSTLNSAYKSAKEKFGIIENLPFDKSAIIPVKKNNAQEVNP